MDIQIEELESNIRATDSQALLDPRIIERVVQMVLKRVKDSQDHEKRVQDEREARPAASAKSTTNWK